MKVLMLIISSNTFPVYAYHREIWRVYMKSHPEIDCYFIEYNPMTFVPVLTNDTLTMRGHERYSTILAKTIDALAYFLPRKAYTHVVRTNLSCVWDFSALLAFLRTVPTSRLYGGIPLKNGGASGAGILFSRDTAELLITYRKHVLTIGTADDDDIGTFMQQIRMPFTNTHRVDFLGVGHYNDHHDKIPPGSFHYRVKIEDPKEDRMNEIHIMTQLLHRIYG
jgi:hypothetical protein